MDFVQRLDNTRYIFNVNDQFINVFSIEKYYAKYFNRYNQNAVFMNWKNVEKKNGYSTIIFAFDTLYRDGSINMTTRLDDITVDQKVNYLIRHYGNNNTLVIHPLIAILFAFTISSDFSVFIISRLPELMGIADPTTRYTNLVQQHNAMHSDYKRIITTQEVMIQELERELENTRKKSSSTFSNKWKRFCIWISCMNVKKEEIEFKRQ